MAAVRAFGPNIVDDIDIYGELKESRMIRNDILKVEKGERRGRRREEEDALECKGEKTLEGGGGNRTGGMFYKSEDDRERELASSR